MRLSRRPALAAALVVTVGMAWSGAPGAGRATLARPGIDAVAPFDTLRQPPVMRNRSTVPGVVEVDGRPVAKRSEHKATHGGRNYAKTTTKYAVVGLSESLREALRGTGVGISAIRAVSFFGLNDGGVSGGGSLLPASRYS